MHLGRLLQETGHDTEQVLAAIDPVDPDQLRLRAASTLVRRLWGPGIDAMTIGRLILVDPAVLNGSRDRLARLAIHELVHVRQWREHGWLGFSTRYLGDYLNGRRRGLSHRAAYLEIRLEVEARAIQAELI